MFNSYMHATLEQHIKKFINISKEDLEKVLPFFVHMQVKKKQNLLIEGTICQHNYFMAKGCTRLFFVNEKGIEQTIQFAIENWWLADYASFEKKQPSLFYIQAVEKCDVLAISYNEQEKMLTQFPQMERYFRLIHQRAHAAAQFRIKNLYTLSREELYHQFNKLYPEFVQRIPQYLLASYLGFTPEYLSELRRRAIS
ncbi:MAG: Crp/Fnr family transcriptional regulator [Agriterribacter sp.]